MYSHPLSCNSSMQSLIIAFNDIICISYLTKCVFLADLVNFPIGSRKSSTTTMSDDKPLLETTLCSICLCTELPDNTGVPLPLCQNPPCGVYFHRNCLFQVTAPTFFNAFFN